MDTELLASIRDQSAQYLSETCVVYERIPQDPTNPGTVSDGMGGWISTTPTTDTQDPEDTNPADDEHYRTYPCRRTVPHTLLRNTQYVMEQIDTSVRTVDLILPHDAVVYNNSKVKVTDANGQVFNYLVTRIEDHSDSVVTHVLCTSVSNVAAS